MFSQSPPLTKIISRGQPLRESLMATGSAGSPSSSPRKCNSYSGDLLDRCNLKSWWNSLNVGSSPETVQLAMNQLIHFMEFGTSCCGGIWYWYLHSSFMKTWCLGNSPDLRCSRQTPTKPSPGLMVDPLLRLGPPPDKPLVKVKDGFQHVIHITQTGDFTL